MQVTLSEVRRALREHEPSPMPVPDNVRDRASVAMILAGADDELEVCVIRRADREGDHWSGHLAFPGGRAHEDDPNAEAVAIRETHEEIGLDLSRAERLGALSHLAILPTGGVLTPFVYGIGERCPPLSPNHEVRDIYWIPLRHLWDPAQSTTIRWPYRGQRLVFPGIRWSDAVIWGLTLRILTSFAEVLGRPLPSKRPGTAGAF